MYIVFITNECILPAIQEHEDKNNRFLVQRKDSAAG
jgi:hypothetical protein